MATLPPIQMPPPPTPPQEYKPPSFREKVDEFIQKRGAQVLAKVITETMYGFFRVVKFITATVREALQH